MNHSMLMGSLQSAGDVDPKIDYLLGSVRCRGAVHALSKRFASSNSIAMKPPEEYNSAS